MERAKYAEGIDENKLCSFYTKNGACRYGNQCTKLHLRPKTSLTLLFAHLYKNPPLAVALADGQPIPDEKIEEVVEHLETWYQEIFLEVSKFGEIREMHICDNLGDHLIGNIYIKFAREEDAESVKKNISRRYYRDRLVMPEFSPVTDFLEGSCRNFTKGGCKRGGSCNFLHVKVIRRELKRALFKKMFKDRPDYLERYNKSSRKDKKSKKHKKDKKEKKDKKKKIKKEKKKKESRRKLSRTDSEKNLERENKKEGSENLKKEENIQKEEISNNIKINENNNHLINNEKKEVNSGLKQELHSEIKKQDN